jgi:hypothetical protein
LTIAILLVCPSICKLMMDRPKVPLLIIVDISWFPTESIFGSLPGPYRIAGTRPARRNARVGPSPLAVRDSALSSILSKEIFPLYSKKLYKQ